MTFYDLAGKKQLKVKQEAPGWEWEEEVVEQERHFRQDGGVRGSEEDIVVEKEIGKGKERLEEETVVEGEQDSGSLLDIYLFCMICED